LLKANRSGDDVVDLKTVAIHDSFGGLRKGGPYNSPALTIALPNAFLALLGLPSLAPIKAA
jgi:hypothetical protein